MVNERLFRILFSFHNLHKSVDEEQEKEDSDGDNTENHSKEENTDNHSEDDDFLSIDGDSENEN